MRIQADTAVIDFLIEMVFFPDEVRHREAGEALLDGELYFYVTAVVFLEVDPFFSVMLGQISGSAIVCLGGLAGTAEVFDEVFSFFQFLVLELQDGAYTLQGEGQAHIGGPDHGAFPGGRIQVVGGGILRDGAGTEVLRVVALQPFGQADALKGSIESPFGDGVIREGGEDFFRDGVAAGQVIDSDGTTIYGDAEDKDLEARGFSVFVGSAFLDIDVGVGFQIDGYFFDCHRLLPFIKIAAGPKESAVCIILPG